LLRPWSTTVLPVTMAAGLWVPCNFWSDHSFSLRPSVLRLILRLLDRLSLLSSLSLLKLSISFPRINPRSKTLTQLTETASISARTRPIPSPRRDGATSSRRRIGPTRSTLTPTLTSPTIPPPSPSRTLQSTNRRGAPPRVTRIDAVYSKCTSKAPVLWTVESIC
jgi:hypothetical protein